MTRDDVSGALVVARMDVRARLRRIRGQPRKLLSFLVLGLLLGVGFPWLLRGSVRGFGSAFVNGPPPVGAVAAVFLGVAGWGGYVGAATAMNRNRMGALGPLLRTSLAPRAVAGGRLLGEVSSMAVATLAPMPVLLALVADGAGTVLASVILVVGALPVIVASLAVGRAVAAVVRLVGLLARLGAWTKAVLLLVLSGGLYLGMQSFVRNRFETDGASVDVAVDPFLPGTPMQSYAEIVLLPFGSMPSLLGVAVALAFAALTVAGVVGTLRVEVRMLSRDGDGDDVDPGTGSRGVPRPFALTASGRVAWRRLLRTARDPKSLAHLFPLSFMLFGVGASWAHDPSAAVQMAPGASVVLGGTFAGAAFCLNPLGDDRDQLSLLLSSVRSTSVLLRGRALAGGVVGVSVTVLAVVVNAVVTRPSPLLEAAVLYAVYVLFAVFFAAMAAGTALGIGAVFPQFERREYMNVERAHPSIVVMICYFLGTLVVGVAGVLLLVTTVDHAFHDGVSTLAYGGWVVYLAVTLTTGLGGYAIAVHRFDALTLDAV